MFVSHGSQGGKDLERTASRATALLASAGAGGGAGTGAGLLKNMKHSGRAGACGLSVYCKGEAFRQAASYQEIKKSMPLAPFRIVSLLLLRLAAMSVFCHPRFSPMKEEKASEKIMP